jgi:hypothetical protein
MSDGTMKKIADPHSKELTVSMVPPNFWAVCFRTSNLSLFSKDSWQVNITLKIKWSRSIVRKAQILFPGSTISNEMLAMLKVN